MIQNSILLRDDIVLLCQSKLKEEWREALGNAGLKVSGKKMEYIVAVNKIVEYKGSRGRSKTCKRNYCIKKTLKSKNLLGKEFLCQ